MYVCMSPKKELYRDAYYYCIVFFGVCSMRRSTKLLCTIFGLFHVLFVHRSSYIKSVSSAESCLGWEILVDSIPWAWWLGSTRSWISPHVPADLWSRDLLCLHLPLGEARSMPLGLLFGGLMVPSMNRWSIAWAVELLTEGYLSWTESHHESLTPWLPCLVKS